MVEFIKDSIKKEDEADLLNVALFGQTAKEWRKDNPEKRKYPRLRRFTSSFDSK